MTTTSKDRLLAWLAAALFLAYLLPNHYSPWLSVHQEIAAFAAFAPLLLWAAVRARTLPALAGFAAIFSVVPLLQLAGGQLFFASDGWLPTLYLMAFALAVLAGAQCVDRPGASPEAVFAPLLWPWLGLLFAALVSVGIQLYQWLQLGDRGIYISELPPGARPFANLAQPNQLATLLLMGLAGVLYLRESARLGALAALALAAMLLAGLVMTGSRSVLLMFVWLLPAYALLRRRCGLRTPFHAILGLAIFYFLSAMAWPLVTEALLLGEATGTAVERMSSFGIRKVFWLSMLDAIGRAPWLGYGWGQVGLAQTATALDYPATFGIFDSAHNLLLDLALWNGLPLALLVIFALLAWFGWQLSRCRDPFSFACLLFVAAVFNHAMVEYPLNYAFFLLPAGFWMGALSARHPSRFDMTGRWASGRVLRGIAGASAAAVLALGAWVAIEYFPFEEDWRLLQFQEKRIGNLEVTAPPPAVVLTGLREFMLFSRTEAVPGMAAQDLEGLRRVTERYGYAAITFRYALAQALNGRAEAAQLTLRRLCKVNRENICSSARQEWAELTRNRYRQLAGVPFPVTEAQQEKR